MTDCRKENTKTSSFITEFGEKWIFPIEKNSIFSRITNSEVFEEIDARKKEAEDKLVNYGFLKEDKQRAKDVISQMIMAMGYSDYDIAFNEKKPVGTMLIPQENYESIHPEKTSK